MMKYSEKSVLEAHVIIMNSIIRNLVHFAFKLAMEEELSDLKPLITMNDEVSNDDMQLLFTVKDPMVVLVVDAADLLFENLYLHKLINGLGDEKIALYSPGEILATDFYWSFIKESEESKRYQNDACRMIFMTVHLCYEFAVLVEHKEYDLEGDDYFIRFLYRYYAMDYNGMEDLVQELDLRCRQAVSLGKLAIELESLHQQLCVLIEAQMPKKRRH